MADAVPAFDDIPSFDDLPDATAQPRTQQAAVPKFDDIPDFDSIKDEQAPEPEGPLARGVRNVAHGVIPAVTGLIGAGAGSVAGAAVGTAAAPGIGTAVGGFVGGVGGAVAGAAAGEKFQHAAQDLLGINDDAQMAANAKAHPWEAAAEQMVPALATMRPDRAATIAQRALSGGVMGGIEGVQEYVNEGNVDPSKVAAAAAVGAVLPSTNRVGERLVGAGRKMVPGRPGRETNPAADQAHEDVGDQSVETAVGDSALAETAPGPQGVTTGNPQSAPQRSDRLYPKDNATAAPEEDILTKGDMDPATAAALSAANPEPAPPAAPPQQRPLGMAPENFRASPPVVEAGFPQAGEPVAVGANEATPLPEGTPARAAAAIAKSKAAMPELKGETALNDSVTDAQKAAGNYPKARTHDFGKPIAIETHAGDTRRSPAGHPEPWENVSPYDYGYFNKTKGPDGDHIDFARPAAGSPELGDKHFIIDQKDAKTGKYDEPKVFTYVKDEAAARDLFNRGFSDGKGEARLHDITEVTRPELVKFLAKHTSNPPKGPFGEPMPKLARDRAVVKDLIAKGKLTEDQVAALPDEQIAKAIEGQRTRKYGIKGGYPVEGLTLANGEPVTANTKTEAAARTASHKAVTDWFEKSAPKSDIESNGALLDRIKVPAVEGWAPNYKPKEWMLMREAKKLLAKPTPGNIAKFKDAERLLRGGDEAVENYRGGNRIEGDIANSRRSGDEAVANAEAKQHNPGVNAEEDARIAAIDAKNGAKFDVPHEEAEEMVTPTPVKSRADLKKLPRKTIDVGDSDLAKVDLKKVDASAAAKRRAEVEALVGKKAQKANVPSEDQKASEGRQIKVNDPNEIKRLIELSNQAMKRKGGIEVPETGEPPIGERKSGLRDLFDKFGQDTSGSLNVNQIKADLNKRTPANTYIARTPNAKREPNVDYTRSLSDRLHQIAQEDKTHRLKLLQDEASWPKELKDPKVMEQIYKAREADSAHVDLPGKQAGKTNIESLSPDIKAMYDEHLKPLFEANDQFADTIRTLRPDRIGPAVEHHVARIVKGDTSKYNMLKDRDDPTGPQYTGLSVDASMAHKRPFVALERVSDGKRFVIQNRDRDGGFTLWDKYKGTRIKDPNYSFEADQPYSVAPTKGAAKIDYIMRHAMSDEIEANARGRDGKGKPMRYYKNAGFSAAITNAQMGSMARHLAEIARLSSTPEFQKLTTRSSEDAEKKGFVETKMPNFKGTYMDPQLAHVFDDYAKPGFDTPETLRNLSQGVTKLLFWMPSAHIANVGAHWFVGRGFDNLNVKRLYETGAQAIKSVMSQDQLQHDLREAGAGTILGGVLTRDFIKQAGQRLGMEIERDPSNWGPIADKIGVPLKKLSDAVYNTSSKVMWAANDMFLTQRILELERRGLPRAQAINKAEQDIPNYRLPTTIGGSGQYARLFQKVMADPVVSSFGRYHYGMFNSYANIIKEAVGAHAEVGDRVDAAGKMLAMGFLAFVAYPVLDKAFQVLTGNEHASANRRGPISIPSHLTAAAKGKEDVMSAARSSLTVPPVWSTLLETLFNRDWRGKDIVEKGDVSSGGVKGAGRAAVQFGEHLARGLVSPYGTVASALNKNKEPGAAAGAKAVGGAVRDQALDLKNPSQAAIKYDQKSNIINYKNANTRFKHGGAGPAEGLYDRVFGR